MHNPRYYDILATRGEKVPTFAECAEVLMALAHTPVGLDLGCGKRRRRGLVGVDKTESEGVVAHDLEDGLPAHWVAADPADVIIADNVFEHINNLIPLLNDCHKMLARRGGRLHITVPNAARSLAAAWSDPTHVRAFTPETFDYLNVDHPRWREYGKSYGFLPWRVLRLVERERFIDVTMRPAA